MNGLLYTVLTLSSTGEPNPLDKLFASGTIERNNHLHPYSNTNPKEFDYIQGGIQVDTQKTFVSSRGITFTGFRVGEDNQEAKASLKDSVRNILVMNSEAVAEDGKDNSFLDLVYAKTYNKLQTRSFITLDMVCSQPKFIIMTKGIPVYFFAIVNDNASYLVWSNEQTLEQRVKEEFGNSFFLYRMPVMENGVCVIQSMFLNKRMRHWSMVLRDKLKVMNALEAHLLRKSKLDKITPVNIGNETDHLVSKSQQLGS